MSYKLKFRYAKENRTLLDARGLYVYDFFCWAANIHDIIITAKVRSRGYPNPPLVGTPNWRRNHGIRRLWAVKPILQS